MVGLPGDDVAARTRSIFDRLRAETAGEEEAPAPAPPPAPEGDRSSVEGAETPVPSTPEPEPAGTPPPAPPTEGSGDPAAADPQPEVPAPHQGEDQSSGGPGGPGLTAPAPAPGDTQVPLLRSADEGGATQGGPGPDTGPGSDLVEEDDARIGREEHGSDRSRAGVDVDSGPHPAARPADAAPADQPVQNQVGLRSGPAPAPAPAPAPPAAPDRGASNWTRASRTEPPPAYSFARPLPRIMAVANQKGGVGKTTTTINLGASLAVLGYRVLVVDLDPQGNATTGLGINGRNLEHSVYDALLHDVPLEDCVEPTSLRHLFVAPSTLDLAGAEIELVPAFSRELRLRRAIEDVADDYDMVLIDCPPSLGLLTVNGLAAAGEVLVPIQCEYYALEGLGQLLRNVNLVQANLNPGLEVSVIVLTMYDARTKLAEQVADEVRAHFGPRVCRNVIPRTVRLSEAPSFGQPIIVFDPSSRGALAYRELAKEVSGGAPQRTG